MSRTLPLFLLILLLPSSSARGKEAPEPLADARFDVALTFPEARPVMPVHLIAEVHARVGVTLVACGPLLLAPLETKERSFKAREALAMLAEHLGGAWRPVGNGGSVFTLGPPPGYERVAALSPARLRAHMNDQWQALLRGLRPQDRKRLRDGETIRGVDLTGDAREPAREIVRALWWRQRYSPACAVRASAAARDAYELTSLPDGVCLLAEQRARTIMWRGDRYPPRYEEAGRQPE